MELQDFIAQIEKVWRFVIFSVDKSDITLGQIIVGIFIFVFGFIGIKFVTRTIDKRFLAKFDLDVSARFTIKSFVFYTMLVFLILFTLRLLSIPLTVFTVLGGALAIGVGFGSQNIVNNFISGLIVMLEKPVRINDFIDIGGLTGRVERIGARSTIVSSTDNTWHVIPNSFLLEKSLLNWTLSDDIIRSSVKVGVAYGSDVKKVEKLLYQAAQDNAMVLERPAPLVLFEDFGDNSLNFIILYYIKATGPLKMRKVASDLRFTINELFNDNQIVIAFPQRDVHLDTLKPLQVELRN
tara:strand:- start:12292 stop:13176 length:885 start_codon:yes stop_codon:yes gene_type:complete